MSVIPAETAGAVVAPTDGDYILLVQGYDETETGPYTMQLRLRRGGFETMAPGEKQIIFVDFLK